MKTCYLYRSDKPEKKFPVIIKDSKEDKGKKVYFGATGYSDYTQHKDYERMKRYTDRHRSRENWNKNGITTAGWWAKNILWNKQSLNSSIRDVQDQFKIKIIKKF